MWVEFVVSSRPCSEGFSPGTPVFLPSQKPKFPKFNSTWKQWTKIHSVDVPLKFPFIINRVGGVFEITVLLTCAS